MSPTRHHWSQAEAERRERVRALGCICCRKAPAYALRWCPMPVEVHHATDTGRQIGNAALIPLCSWHHRSICLDGRTSSQMTDLFGPSLAKGSKPFTARYGSQSDLLADIAQLERMTAQESEPCSS